MRAGSAKAFGGETLNQQSDGFLMAKEFATEGVRPLAPGV